MPQWRHGRGSGRTAASDPYAAYNVYDTFTDTNGTLLPNHVPEKAPAGSSWANIVGTAFSIQSNKAICNGGNDVTVDIAASISDCTITVSDLIIGAFNGIAARLTNGTNLFCATYYTALQRWELNRLEAAYNLIGSYSEARSAGDSIDPLQMVLSGSSISVLVNGVSRIAVTDTFNQTAKKHGLYGYGENGTAKYGSFSVVA